MYQAATAQHRGDRPGIQERRGARAAGGRRDGRNHKWTVASLTSLCEAPAHAAIPGSSRAEFRSSPSAARTLVRVFGDPCARSVRHTANDVADRIASPIVSTAAIASKLRRAVISVRSPTSIVRTTSAEDRRSATKWSRRKVSRQPCFVSVVPPRVHSAEERTDSGSGLCQEARVRA